MNIEQDDKVPALTEDQFPSLESAFTNESKKNKQSKNKADETKPWFQTEAPEFKVTDFSVPWFQTEAPVFTITNDINFNFSFPEFIPNISAEPFIPNISAEPFIPNFSNANCQEKPKWTPKTTLFDFINKPAKFPHKPKSKQPKKQMKDPNKMLKAHIIQDGQVVTAKIAKKDLYSGAYEVVPRKVTKIKQAIKAHRVDEGLEPNKRPLHSESQPREYVDNILTQDLDIAIQEFIEKLLYFYNRKKEEKSNKKVPKRFVKGIKECLKKCEEGSLKCLIVAPNIEKVDGEGGLDALILELITNCKAKNIPVVFGLNMRALGSILINQAVLIGCIGILDYTATEKLYDRMIKIYKTNKERFVGEAYNPEEYFNLVY
jgi:ribosomal protein L7Ae-like RNA K-turn-binding protein